jgi:5-methylthioadenosine/S-adenosylhomocysteine deaminase
VVSQLVYAANRRQVSDVWVGGERRLRAGAVAGMDMAALRANAQRWASRIAEAAPA